MACPMYLQIHIFLKPVKNYKIIKKITKHENNSAKNKKRKSFFRIPKMGKLNVQNCTVKKAYKTKLKAFHPIAPSSYLNILY